MSQPRTMDIGQRLTLLQRRAFMKLPIDERRRQMAEQAERMVEYYETGEEARQRSVWQGGDIVEPR